MTRTVAPVKASRHHVCMSMRTYKHVTTPETDKLWGVAYPAFSDASRLRHRLSVARRRYMYVRTSKGALRLCRRPLTFFLISAKSMSCTNDFPSWQ